MIDLSISNTLAVDVIVCVVFNIIGIMILSDPYYFVSNKMFKIKNVFSVSSFIIYISLFLIISYSIGVFVRLVYYGDFVLFDDNLMNTLFFGSTGLTKAVHFAYTVSSIILVVIYKYYIYEPDIEKQG